MLFPSDELLRRRTAILRRVDAGEITDQAGALEALQADPRDANALLCLAHHAEHSGDLEEAERYAREVIRNHPNGSEGYGLLAEILERRQPGSELAAGYLQLCRLKRDLEPGAPAEPEEGEVEGLDDLLEVEDELQPHRLIHQLREERELVLERSLVDAILAHATECEPLLLGILKEYAEEQLEDYDFSVVERALVLLGEIGNISSLPSIAEFLSGEDEDVSGPADWAFRRISFRKPDEALAVIREMLPRANLDGRALLAEQLALMPDVPGRREALDELIALIPDTPAADRGLAAVSAMNTCYLLEGGSSPRAKAVEQKYASSFSKELLAGLRKLQKQFRGMAPYKAEPDDLTVYDICCVEPVEDEHHHDHDGGGHEPMRVEPKPGRNEPCWCGSGKKYKKCHLDEDERR